MMNKKNFKKIIDKYARFLKNDRIKPLRYPLHKVLTDADQMIGYELSHCYYLLTQMTDEFIDTDPEKALRWLCFVQGVFWANRYYSINAFRKHNKSIIEE